MDEEPTVIKDRGVPPIVLKKPSSNKEAQKPVNSNFVNEVPPETERLFSNGKDQEQTVLDQKKGILHLLERLVSLAGTERENKKSIMPVSDQDFIREALRDSL